MSQRLPDLPNLDHLKKQAKDVLRVSRHRSSRWCLADAQHALARGYGFPSWADLKHHVESVRQQRGGAAPLARVREDAVADAISTAAQDQPGLPGPRIHPITGAWATRPAVAFQSRTDVAGGNVVMEIELTDDGILNLTQIAVDPAGHESAMKMAIRADSQDHPIQFGDDLVLQATWTDGRTLETIVKHKDTMVAKGKYQVSADGQSLVVSTPDQVIVFERVSSCSRS